MPEINSQNLEQELRSLIASIVEIDEKKITPEAKFIEDLGMDSMMALEILASVEKKYKIRIPEENLAKMTNLNKVADLVKGFLSK
ncbi:MAG: acyl carrier protein [Candidatus Omnitrophica bacterium]|nr:acyl carrier protein [Candidatus Omnitrophota bacterium]